MPGNYVQILIEIQTFFIRKFFFDSLYVLMIKIYVAIIWHKLLQKHIFFVVIPTYFFL